MCYYNFCCYAGVVQWLESQPSKLVVWVRFPSPAPTECLGAHMRNRGTFFISFSLAFRQHLFVLIQTIKSRRIAAFLFSESMGIEPAVRSLAVPVVAALPLATADRGASFCSLYHPQDALATSPITRSKRVPRCANS